MASPLILLPVQIEPEAHAVAQEEASSEAVMQPEALAAGRQGQGRHAQRELGAGAGKAVPADGFGSGVENIGSVRRGALEGLVHRGVALGEAQDIKIEKLRPWNGNCGGAPLLEDGDVQSPRLQAQSVEAARVQKNEAAAFPREGRRAPRPRGRRCPLCRRDPERSEEAPRGCRPRRRRR